MGIMDDAKDMKDKAQDKLDSTELDDETRTEMERMRRQREENGELAD